MMTQSRLTMHPLCRETAEKVRNTRNKDISPYRTPYMLTAEMQQEWYDSVTDRSSDSRMWEFHNESNVCVAVGGLTNIQWENGVAEINLVVGERHRRQGHGREAVKMILDEAFRSMRLVNVYGEVYEYANVKFWMAMRPDYTTMLPSRKYHNGTHHDSVYFCWYKSSNDKGESYET